MTVAVKVYWFLKIQVRRLEAQPFSGVMQKIRSTHLEYGGLTTTKMVHVSIRSYIICVFYFMIQNQIKVYLRVFPMFYLEIRNRHVGVVQDSAHWCTQVW